MTSDSKRAPGVGARVLGGFAGVILVFGAAAAFSLRAQEQALDRLDDVNREEAAARTALRLSTAVRQLYIHQSHVILIGGTDHPQYAEALTELSREVEAARASPVFARNPQAAQRIRETVEQLVRVFREQIVPAMEAQDWAKVRSEHVRAERLVVGIVEEADALQSRAIAEVARVRAEAETQADRLRAVTLALLGIAVAIAAVIALYLLRTVVRPLRSLIDGARRIGGGDLRVRLPVRSSDEVGRLAESFNTMAGALEEHQERLVSAEKLAGLGRMAAGVSHELNNPLGVAKGYVRLMKKQAPPALQDDLRIIDTELARCQEIVDELLGLARVTRERRDDALDLAELARAAVERHLAMPVDATAALRVEPSPALPTRGDPERLARVLTNLIRNAAQAAGPKGHVFVRGGVDGDSVWLAVEDDGPGIPAEIRGRLFEPFFTTKAHGTGLGLAVSLAIAREHRGTLEAGEREGGGARFTLRLPRSSEAEGAAA